MWLPDDVWVHKIYAVFLHFTAVYMSRSLAEENWFLLLCFNKLGHMSLFNKAKQFGDQNTIISSDLVWTWATNLRYNFTHKNQMKGKTWVRRVTTKIHTTGKLNKWWKFCLLIGTAHITSYGWETKPTDILASRSIKMKCCHWIDAGFLHDSATASFFWWLCRYWLEPTSFCWVVCELRGIKTVLERNTMKIINNAIKRFHWDEDNWCKTLKSTVVNTLWRILNGTN